MDHRDTEALDALFRAHYNRVARVIGRIVHDQAHAEEIAVEVFLKWQRHPNAHGAQAEGWLYRTAVRDAIDVWRREARWARIERVLAPFRDAPRTPAQLHALDRERLQVRTVLGGLRRRHVELLLLWVEDLSYADIATAIAVRPSSVGSLLRRAQDAFRKAYEDRYGQQS